MSPKFSNDPHLEQLLTRTGIGQQLLDEKEADRTARHAEARKKKAQALAKYLKDKVPAIAAIESAEARARKAQKDAEDANNEYIAARGAFDNVYGTLSSVVEDADRVMRSCYDPMIDAFLADLATAKAATPGMAVQWADPKGKYTDLAGRKVSDNRVDIQARVVAINALQDEAERLKVNPNIDDVAAEIERLRKLIPNVPMGPS